jgi:hypothetical protein
VALVACQVVPAGTVGSDFLYQRLLI